MDLRVITNIEKEYPHMIKLLSFKTPKYYVSNDVMKRHAEEVERDYVPSVSSLSRTKTLVRDIVLCNDFDFFCTFTFDPKKVNRYSFPACSYKMRVWLHHQRDLATLRGQDFLYLIIPEQHKDGAWHFHALLSGYTSTLHDTGLKTSSLRPIYNITSFRSGFTTAVPIDSKESVASYVTKYITKDFIKMFNKKRFFASKGLIRPIKRTNTDTLSKVPPLMRQPVGQDFYTETFIFDIDFF